MEITLKRLIDEINNNEEVMFLNLNHNDFSLRNIPIDEAVIEDGIFYCYGDTDICHEKAEVIIHINMLKDVRYNEEESKYIINQDSTIFEIVSIS